MKKYTVTFAQYHMYDVEADNDDEAYNKAHEEFLSDMRRSVANTIYDEVEIECENDDYEEEYDDEEEE